MLRIALFAATNIAVLAVLTVVMKVLGLESALAREGFNTTGLLIMAAAYGMIGSFISLALSKTMAKRSVRAQTIDQPRNETERWLVSTVARQAEAAGIGMPEVAIYDSPDMNAFATGMRKNASLVAVSTGLLNGMSQDEVEGVLAHEVSHIANGDMVTMALLQGVLNTFVIFFARIIGMLVDRVVFRNERGFGPGAWMVSLVAQMVLGVLASIIAMWFSRHREFRADAGSAAIESREKMVAALRRLGARNPAHDLPEEVEAFGISGRRSAGFERLFMSHPPIEERIAALQNS